MSNFQDPDHFRFRQYAEGNHSYPYDSDSPLDLSGRDGAPRTCPGFNDEPCGDEVDSDEYCPTHQRESDRAEQVATGASDEEIEALVSYPHLTD